MAGGEVVAVAEDGPQCLWDYSGCCRAANQLPVDAEGLQPAVQPLRPARVAVAVGEERAVLEWDRRRHEPSAIGSKIRQRDRLRIMARTGADGYAPSKRCAARRSLRPLMR